MIRRALGGVLAIAMAALASPAAAQGDFVTHYRGLLAGYANQSNGYVDFYRSEHGYYARLAASPSLTGNVTWRLPVSYGAGSCIKDDGAGNLYVGSCGIGDLVAGNNLSELTATASTARANIGAQAAHASLTALAGLTYAADKCTYWSSSSAAATFDCGSYGRGLIGAADAVAARTAMGLGTMATQASSSISITGGSIAGITDLALADGGTGASTASIARTNLGVAIGQDVQAQNANLQALADLTYAASKCTYWSSSSAAATFDCSTYGRSLIGSADAAAARTAMGLGSLATLSVAPTATALASNGTNCSAGSYPLGVDASGNAESCTSATLADNSTAYSGGTSNGFVRSTGSVVKTDANAINDGTTATFGGSSNGSAWTNLSGILGRSAIVKGAGFGSGATSQLEFGETSANRPTIGPGNGTYLQLLFGTTGLLLTQNNASAFMGLWTPTGLYMGGAASATSQLELSTLSLTTGTATVENVSAVREGISSYTLTNAQVAALGASLTGDITIATLKAKMVVNNAYLVVTGTAAGVTTLTVSCGRSGASYDDYIQAVNAKVAANTRYGATSGERGTNLTGYDQPSYTGTTPIVCHFTSTGANLSAVTGFSMRVILHITLIP